MITPFKTLLYIVGAIVALGMVSCQKDKTVYQLEYSVDTVWFDTMFADVPTSVKSFTVYNKSEIAVELDRVSLKEDREYRLNVNGLGGNVHTNVTIPPKDSLFVFVDATFLENDHDSIASHENAIVFEYASFNDELVIASWAQDVTKNTGRVVKTETWSDQRPYIIYDSLVVEEGHTLTIEAGVELYFHYGADFIVYGELVVNGTQDNPVIFAADRPEQFYKNNQGQWGSIRLMNSGTNHSFDWTVVKNGTNALVFEDDELKSSLSITNSRFENFSERGLVLRNVDFVASNSLFARSSDTLLTLSKGGSCLVEQCTFYDSSYGASIAIENSVDGEEYDYSARFNNCLIAGSSDQIKTDSAQMDKVDLLFYNCMLNLSDDLQESLKNNFEKNVSFDVDAEDIPSSSNYKYSLSEDSEARNSADSAIASQYPVDLDGNERFLDGKPDIGAFEFVKPEEDGEEASE